MGTNSLALKPDLTCDLEIAYFEFNYLSYRNEDCLVSTLAYLYFLHDLNSFFVVVQYCIWRLALYMLHVWHHKFLKEKFEEKNQLVVTLPVKSSYGLPGISWVTVENRMFSVLGLFWDPQPAASLEAYSPRWFQALPSREVRDTHASPHHTSSPCLKLGYVHSFHISQSYDCFSSAQGSHFHWKLYLWMFTSV